MKCLDDNFILNLVKKRRIINEFKPESVKKELELLSYFLNVKQRIGENWFFDIVELTEKYQEIDFNFSASTITLVNDSINNLEFSWDGNNRAGLLYNKEILPIDSIERDKIFVQGSHSCRIWAI